MGLFKKRASDPDEMERLRAELADMSARLDATDAAEQELDAHVRQLAARLDDGPTDAPIDSGRDHRDVDLLRAQLQRLSDRVEASTDSFTTGDDASAEVQTRLDELAARLDEIGTFDTPQPIGARDLNDLSDRLDALNALVTSSMVEPPDHPLDAESFRELRQRVDEIGARFDTPLTEPPPAPPAEPTDAARPAVGPTELRELHDRLDALDARLDGVDVRITSISTELANQISEISGDIDALGDAGTGELVEDLRDAQTRLANEQARYQIAFRQDLAELAERLKRT